MMGSSDKDFKGCVITMLHVVKENILEMNGKIEIISREIETQKRTK